MTSTLERDVAPERDETREPDPSSPITHARGVGTSLAAAVGVLALVVGGLAWIGGATDDSGGDTSGGDEAAAGDGAAGASADDDVDDLGLGMLQNGHHAEMELQELDAATQAELDAQLAITREVAVRYPTLGDAIDDGYERAGPFSPGLGIHYNKVSGPALNDDGVMDEEDLRNPLSLIFDGTGRDAKIAGFMYYSLSAEEPEGFAGRNDFWHYHTNVCIQPAPDGTNAPFGADRAVPKERCDAVGGSWLPRTTWMTHVWTVPGYEVGDADGGTFAEVNPALTCPDGTYFIMDEDLWIDHPTSNCRSEVA